MLRAVARFTLGSVAAIAVIAVGGYLALRQVALDEARRDTRARVLAAGRVVEAAGLTDGVLRGDRRALTRLDDLVLGQVLGGPVVRVKLWTEDGTILYSDEPALIGQRYALGEEERELFETGGAEVESSDLSEPENRFERPQGKLLEAYTTIRSPDGTQVLFETYERFAAVDANAERLLRAFAPPLLAGLLVLVLVQVPLAWSLARRLQRGHTEREALLESAVAASDHARRRIASDLHDGVVQDLAGVAFGLAPLADAAQRRGATDEAETLRNASERLRQGVRDLRTLLVEIHPPNLASAGLDAALSDLLSPLAAAGVETELEIAPDAAAPVGDDARLALLYGAAREAVRNAQEHGDPSAVRIALRRSGPDTLRLTIADDGRGFDPDARRRAAAAGHVGLALLEGLAAQAGGTLAVRSAPGEGTTVELEVPAP
ncbi:MAG TPA: ATP-binding protein [Conexibacter sp.]|nr:ATP-binding protein [Conexibacter sp.]